MSLEVVNCKICGNLKDNKYYFAREMMFGYRDVFKYLECSECGCLQLVNIPDNLAKYYPENYYAHTEQNYYCGILA